MSLAIILCTYNEENNIKECLDKLIKYKEIKEIIIIDDNSRDNTLNIISEFHNQKIKLHVRKKIKGFASAFIYGLKNTESKYILRLDVDMHDQISYLMEKFIKNKNYDFVNFSRYINKGKDLRGNLRKYSSKLINKICYITLSKKITDYTSCIFFIKKSLLKDVFPKNTKYANFIIEFVYSIITKQKNFKEFPFIQDKNTENFSKSAPNLIKFFLNGSLYLTTILKCLIYKLKNN